MIADRNTDGNHGSDRADHGASRFGANTDVASQADHRDAPKAAGGSLGHGGQNTDGSGTSGDIEGHNAGGGPAGQGGSSGA